MIVLVSGTDKQTDIFRMSMREKVSFVWYTYDFIPKQFLEYIDVDPNSTAIKDRELLKALETALEKHSDVCYRDCMTVIENYLENPTAEHLVISVPATKIIKFKDLKCKKVKIISDPNLVSGSMEHEKYSLYDYALYNAHDKKTMKRKVAEFVRWLEKKKGEDND